MPTADDPGRALAAILAADNPVAAALARPMAAALAVQRDDLLARAQAKTPGVRITAEASADDADALRAEITALREFVDRPTPGLHTDTYDEDADGPNVDPTNV